MASENSLKSRLKRLGRVLLAGAISGIVTALVLFLKEMGVQVFGTEMPVFTIVGTALLNALGKWLREKGISIPIPF